MAVCAGMATGCSGLLTLPVDPPPEGTETVLLAVEGDAPRVFGGPVDAFTRDVPILGGELLFVAYYRQTLDDLGVTASTSERELVPLILADVGRSLDGFAAGWVVRAERGGAWEPVSETPREFADVRLAAGERGPCRELRGEPLRTVESTCDQLPERPDRPQPPAPPFGPTPASFDCTFGPSPESYESGIAGCAPFDPPAFDCEDDERFDFASEACVAVDGGACAFASVPANAIHVDATAKSGGNGTPMRPYDDLALAFAAASAGDTIAIAAGRYTAATWTIPDGVSILGHCAANTIVDASRITFSDVTLDRLTLEAPAIEQAVGGAAIAQRSIFATQNFFVSGALDLSSSRVRGGGTDPLDLVFVAATGDVRFDDVTLGPAFGNTFHAAGARATLTNVALFGARGMIIGPGLGLVAQSNAFVTLTSVTIDDTDRIGMLVSSSTVVVDRVAIRDRRLPVPTQDLGLVANQGSSLRGKDLYFAAAQQHALVVVDSTANIDGLIVEDSVPSQVPGTDLTALLGVHSRIALDDVHARGRPAALSIQEGTTLVASDVVVEGTPGPHAFYGVIARPGTTLNLTRAHVQGVSSGGVVTVGPETFGHLEDVVVASMGNSTGEADGLSVQGFSTVEAYRVRVKDVVGRGVNLTGEGATLTLEHAEVSGTREGSDATAFFDGAGIAAGPLTSLTLRRAHVYGNEVAGVFGYGATPTIEDVAVETTTLRRGLVFENDPPPSLPEVVGDLRRVSVTVTQTPHPEGVTISPAYAAFGVTQITATVTDVTIHGAEYFGVRLDSGQFLDNTSRKISIDRMEVVDTRGTGVSLDNGTDAAIKNLYVGGSTNEGMLGASAINAIKCDLRLEDFRLENNATIGLQLEKEQRALSSTVLRRGLIVGNTIAIQVPVVETSEIQPVQVYLQSNELIFNTP